MFIYECFEIVQLFVFSVPEALGDLKEQTRYDDQGFGGLLCQCAKSHCCLIINV
jgi:hypothetical protein